jgi:hypothetical protein
MRAPLFALAALAVAGCTDFDPASLVTGLRVLGIKADPPEIPSGATSTLHALVVTPPGSDAGAPSLEWAACHLAPVPSSGLAVNPDCLTTDSADFLEPLGSGDTVTVTMPLLGSPLDLGLPDSTGGFYLSVRLRARLNGQAVDSIYRLRYAAFGAPNHNPTLTGIYHVLDTDDGGVQPETPVAPLDPQAPLAVHLGDKVRLRAGLTDDSIESFTAIIGDPRDMMFSSATEQPRFLWYVTAGQLSDDVTGVERPDTVLTFDKHAPTVGDTVGVYLVVHDDRGGTDWLVRTLQIE